MMVRRHMAIQFNQVSSLNFTHLTYGRTHVQVSSGDVPLCRIICEEDVLERLRRFSPDQIFCRRTDIRLSVSTSAPSPMTTVGKLSRSSSHAYIYIYIYIYTIDYSTILLLPVLPHKAVAEV